MSENEIKAAGIRRSPRNLLAAIFHVRDDDFSERVLGSAVLQFYLAYKADEWERYHQTVTDC